jgi:hypothetical protein
MSSKKVNFGIGFIILLALISLGYNLQFLDPISFFEKIQRSGSLINLSISRFENKFACLESEIKADRQYGFLTITENSTTASELYILTQYTLAPAVIVNSRSPEFIVGYFSAPVDLQKTRKEQPNLIVLKQCDEDTALFQTIP